MSTETNKAIVRRLFEEVVSQKRLDLIDAIIADDIVTHTIVPGVAPNREGFRQFLTVFLDAFPEQTATVDALIAEGDLVVARHTHTVTHGGNFMGLPPSGKHAAVQGIEIFRVVDGRIVEMWHQDDLFSLLAQLGAIPMPG